MAIVKKPKAAKGNVTLQGHLDVPDLRFAAVMYALEKHIELTRAEEGCIYFSVTPAHDNPSRLVIDEIFENAAAFDHHQRRSAASAWGEVSKGIPRHVEMTVVN